MILQAKSNSTVAMMRQPCSSSNEEQLILQTNSDIDVIGLAILY